jgi:lipopolysaccharide transport system permease protein
MRGQAQADQGFIVLRPTAGWRAVNLRELWRFRDLVWALAIRDVKLRYRQTALGVIWVVLQPLLAAGIFSFVFGSVAGLSSGNVPYVVFAFAGLLGWNLFQNTVAKGSISLVSNASMLSKIFFPRLALPMSTVPGTVLDFTVGLGAFLVVAALKHSLPGLPFLTLPLWIVLMLCIGLGLGLLSAALMVSYRDVGQAVPVALQMLLYITPIAYSLDSVPSNLRFVYALNPLVGVLEGFRWALVPGYDAQLGYAAYSAAFAVVALVVGLVGFARMERKFADVI